MPPGARWRGPPGIGPLRAPALVLFTYACAASGQMFRPSISPEEISAMGFTPEEIAAANKEWAAMALGENGEGADALVTTKDPEVEEEVLRVGDDEAPAAPVDGPAAPQMPATAPVTTTTTRNGPTTLVLPGTPNETDLTESKEKLAEEPWSPTDLQPGECKDRFTPPPNPPQRATDFNGMALPDTCFTKHADLHHVFVIGDWGGVTDHPWDLNVSETEPVPADHRSKLFGVHHRKFVWGADNCAQQNVAREMAKRAAVSDPAYVLNVGDNFYWGGIAVKCGAPPYMVNDFSGQWQHAFEDIYAGPGLDGKQWLSVLGNHDFGGFMFTNGWDQAIAYTWSKHVATSTGRWVMPALYYSAKVRYNGAGPENHFSVDYFFMDTNVFDAFEPSTDQNHNICSEKHNQKHGATCGVQGPVSVEECPKWFQRLWRAQLAWVEDGLQKSTADWQIIVTHFPAEGAWGATEAWVRLSKEYGIDLFITGHRHTQEVHYMDELNILRPTAYIVSGGGGGITSEGMPTPNGTDDMYGFMDLGLSHKEIKVEAISHGGQIRSTTCIRQRLRGGAAAPAAGKSLCDDVPAGPYGDTDPPTGALGPIKTTTTAAPSPDGAAVVLAEQSEEQVGRELLETLFT